jgi:hypothetical protein
VSQGAGLSNEYTDGMSGEEVMGTSGALAVEPGVGGALTDTAISVAEVGKQIAADEVL